MILEERAVILPVPITFYAWQDQIGHYWYIGQTADVKKRWKDHRKSDRYHQLLQRGIQVNLAELETIPYQGEDEKSFRDIINIREKKWMLFYLWLGHPLLNRDASYLTMHAFAGQLIDHIWHDYSGNKKDCLKWDDEYGCQICKHILPIYHLEKSEAFRSIEYKWGILRAITGFSATYEDVIRTLNLIGSFCDIVRIPMRDYLAPYRQILPVK